MGQITRIGVGMRFIILSMGFFFSLSVLGLPTTFPEILEWKKSPIIELENQKMAVLKKNGQLKNAFVVVTANEDEVILKFSGGEVVTIMPRSKVQVPQVSPESDRKKNGQLKNAFVVVTANEDEVILKFSGGEVVTIMPRSKVQVPQVSPE